MDRGRNKRWGEVRLQKKLLHCRNTICKLQALLSLGLEKLQPSPPSRGSHQGTHSLSHEKETPRAAWMSKATWPWSAVQERVNCFSSTKRLKFTLLLEQPDLHERTGTCYTLYLHKCCSKHFILTKQSRQTVFFSLKLEDCHVITWDAEKAKAAVTQIQM